MVLVFVATEDSLAAVAALKLFVYFNLFFDVTTEGLLLVFFVGDVERTIFYFGSCCRRGSSMRRGDFT